MGGRWERKRGEESDDEGGVEVVLVRGIEEGGEARGDESRPLPVWHPGRKVGKVTSRARAAQAVEGAVRDAQAAQGTGGKERVQGVGMAVDEEATLVLRKGRGRPKRSAKVSWRSGRLCSGGASTSPKK